MTGKRKGRVEAREAERRCEELPGIVIAGGRRSRGADRPRIAAFVWGGKVHPTPPLPYGRWKGVA